VPQHEVSNSLKERLNNETMGVLNDCTAAVEKSLRENWTKVEKLATELLEKSELDFDAIDAIFKGQIQNTNPETPNPETPNPETPNIS